MGQDQVAEFRAYYRREHIGARYSGIAHFCFTTGTCLAAMALCISRLHAVRWWEWLVVPATFFFANLVEHAGHRGPMHHPRKGLGLIFERHTRQHHRFFTELRMEFEGTRDFKAVLFPPVLLLFFFGAFAVPVGVPLALLTSANIGWLFALTSIGYFLNYELLHFSYHTAPDSWIARLPGMAVLRRHHTTHHDQELMSHYNFNISYPIADRLLGTLYREEKPAPVPARAPH